MWWEGGIRTSTKVSKEGTARSKIEWRIRSGSMTLIDFRALWMFVTVVES
jgi:hypothetical protein